MRIEESFGHRVSVFAIGIEIDELSEIHRTIMLKIELGPNFQVTSKLLLLLLIEPSLAHLHLCDVL